MTLLYIIYCKHNFVKQTNNNNINNNAIQIKSCALTFEIRVKPINPIELLSFVWNIQQKESEWTVDRLKLEEDLVPHPSLWPFAM